MEMIKSREELYRTKGKLETAVAVLVLIVIILASCAFSTWRENVKLRREANRIAPELRNYNDGFNAGYLHGLDVSSQIDISTLHIGSSGSVVIRILGTPDGVEVTHSNPLGEPCEWTWKYGDVVLTMRPDDEVKGEQWLSSWQGPLAELIKKRTHN